MITTSLSRFDHFSDGLNEHPFRPLVIRMAAQERVRHPDPSSDLPVRHIPLRILQQVQRHRQPNQAFHRAQPLHSPADWVGVPDAFWWRDTWVLLSEVARATSRIAIGPLVTNPYLRHPFHTAAAIATIQEIAGPRVFVGIGAGGSEVSGAATIR